MQTQFFNTYEQRLHSPFNQVPYDIFRLLTPDPVKNLSMLNMLNSFHSYAAIQLQLQQQQVYQQQLQFKQKIKHLRMQMQNYDLMTYELICLKTGKSKGKHLVSCFEINHTHDITPK